MLESHLVQIARQINYKRTQLVHSMSALKPTLEMFKLTKKHKLIPEHCNEYEFTIAQTSDDEIICFGWSIGRPINEPTNQSWLVYLLNFNLRSMLTHGV